MNSALCPYIRPARRLIVAMMIGRALSMSALSTTERADRCAFWYDAVGVSVDAVRAAVGVPAA